MPQVIGQRGVVMEAKYGLDIAGVTCDIVAEIHQEGEEPWKGFFHLKRMKSLGQFATLQIFSDKADDRRNASVQAILANDIIAPLAMVHEISILGPETINIALNSPDPNANFSCHFLPALVDAIPRIRCVGCEHGWIIKDITYNNIGHNGDNVNEQLMHVAKQATHEATQAMS